MKYFLKAITTNNRDLKTAIYFSIEEKAYLFNCPDGFQRLALCQKMRFKNVRYVFLSNLHPDFYAGFPGFYLSTREAQAGNFQNFKVGVIGPRKLKQALQKSRSFLGTLNLLEIFEYGQLDRYYTEVVDRNLILGEVRMIQTNQKVLEEVVEQDEELKQDDEKASKHEFRDDQLSVTPLKVKSPIKGEQDTYSFICVPRQAKGKFLPKQAIALGLDPKNHFKILNEGNPVTLENGDIIYPFQVLEEPLPSQSFIFVFLPSEHYLEDFISEENLKQFSPFFASNIDLKKSEMHLIYHSVPLNVLLNPKYREFMHLFGANVKHIIDCKETNNEVISKTKAYALSSRHNLVCPSLVPLSKQALNFYADKTKTQLRDHFKDFDYINSQVGLVYNLYPVNTRGLDLSQAVTLSEINSEYEQKIQVELTHAVRSIMELKSQQNLGANMQDLYNASQEIDDKEPNILFLGTVSMKPTMYRAASAVFLFIKGKGILMDCAEGSYGQIYDHFQDIEKVNEAILKLRVVFITHIHGDHQLGIIKIMSERDKLLQGFDPDNKLYIVIPTPMQDYIQDYINSTLTYPEMIVLVPSWDLNPEPDLYYEIEDENGKKVKQSKKPICPERSLEEVNQMLQKHVLKTPEAIELYQVLASQFNISFIKAIENDHCIQSYACLIDSPDFGRIFYSGDTKPCQTILNYAQQVTLLIHEATFDDSLAEDADWKKHTTMGQAIEIVRKCQPWRSVLTHFSPRYQKIAETDKRHVDNKIMVAFDHMRFKLSYLEWAYQFLDIYSRLFTNDDSIESQEPNQAQNQANKKAAAAKKQQKGKQ